MAIRIYAHHAHVFPETVRAEGSIPRLLKLLDTCGIDGAVCFAPFASQVGADLKPNRWLADQLRTQPRLAGFGTIDFARRDFPGQVKEIVDLGLRGIKLHPPFQEFDVLSAEARAVYEAAQKHDLLCTFHTAVHHYRLRAYAPYLFDEIAHDFPDLRFTMEHVGGYHFFNETLGVIVNNTPPPWVKKRANVFAGFTSVFTTQTNRFWHLTDAQLRETVEQTSAEQCIFGLDFPYNLETETAMGIQTLCSLGLADDQLAKILGGNIRRELKIT